MASTRSIGPAVAPDAGLPGPLAGQISVPGACQPGAQLPLPPFMSPEAADALLPRVFASAAPPPALLTPLLNPG